MRFAIVMVVLVASVAARAEAPPAEPKMTAGISMTYWLPQADADNTTDNSLGIRPQFAYWIQPFIAAIASFDYVFVNEKPNVASVTYYAISLGARATTPKPMPVRPYAEFLLGRHKLETTGVDDANLGFRIGGGATVALGDKLVGSAGISYSSVSIDTQGGIFATSVDIEAVILDLGIAGRF